jgi:hypothetical protein
MEIIAILRVLRRRWVFVAIGLALSAVIAVATIKAGGASQLEGRAWGSLLLGAPDSTASAYDNRIADTIPERATLLADLMTTEAARSGIARIAGVAPDDFVVRGPAMGAPQVPIPLAVSAEASGLQVAPYLALITTQDPVTGDGVPIIGINVFGSSAAVAARIVNGVRGEMSTLVRQETTTSPPAAVFAESLGPVETATQTVSAGGKSTGATAAVMILMVWCFGVVVLDAVVRRRRARRRARELERRLAAAQISEAQPERQPGEFVRT